MSLSPSTNGKAPRIREMRLGRELTQQMIGGERDLRHTVASGGSHELKQDMSEQKRQKQEKLERKKDELNKRIEGSLNRKKKRPPRESIVNIADECVSKQLTIQNATIEIQEDYFGGAEEGRGLSIVTKKPDETIEEVAEEPK